MLRWAVSGAMWLDDAKIDKSLLAYKTSSRIAILVAVLCLQKATHDAAIGCQLTNVAGLSHMREPV